MAGVVVTEGCGSNPSVAAVVAAGAAGVCCVAAVRLLDPELVCRSCLDMLLVLRRSCVRCSALPNVCPVDDLAGAVAAYCSETHRLELNGDVRADGAADA
jgi:hypothetical protein